MIENGVLTYGAIQEGISSWRFGNDVLNEVVVAVLLTIISYQAVEMMISLSFGMKPRGRARLRDIQIMLLIRKSSPIAVLRAIFPWHRRRKRVALSEAADDMSETDTDTGRRGFWISASVYTKLFCLLFAIPLVNVGSVVLSLERDKDLTFAEAKFGGLAFGIDFQRSIKDFALISRTPKAFCESITVEKNTADFPIALFRSCARDILPSNNASRKDVLIVSLRSTPVELAFVSVTVGSQVVVYEKRLMIVSDMANISSSKRNGQLYYLKSSLTVSDAQLLANQGVELINPFCNATELGMKIDRGPEERNFSVSFTGVCQRESGRSPSENLKIVRNVALVLLSQLSFLDSDEFLVRPDEDESRSEFINGDDLLLLSRRRSLVSIPIMAILALAVVVVRLIAQLVTNNDLERGIGLIVRDGLGLPCCDSMLCSQDVVAQYDSQGQILYDVNRSHAGRREAEISLVDDSGIYP